MTFSTKFIRRLNRTRGGVFLCVFSPILLIGSKNPADVDNQYLAINTSHSNLTLVLVFEYLLRESRILMTFKNNVFSVILLYYQIHSRGSMMLLISCYELG